MKFLSECKHTDVTWPKSGCSYQARVRTRNLQFTWPIYEFELGNSDFWAFWNAA